MRNSLAKLFYLLCALSAGKQTCPPYKTLEGGRIPGSKQLIIRKAANNQYVKHQKKNASYQIVMQDNWLHEFTAMGIYLLT